jgi:hypothetical protein
MVEESVQNSCCDDGISSRIASRPTATVVSWVTSSLEFCQGRGFWFCPGIWLSHMPWSGQGIIDVHAGLHWLQYLDCLSMVGATFDAMLRHSQVVIEVAKSTHEALSKESTYDRVRHGLRLAGQPRALMPWLSYFWYSLFGQARVWSVP